MMSLPDFREKQLLIIQAKDIASDGLQFHNENISLKRDGVVVNQLSCHKVLAVWILGDCTITTVLIKQCQEYGVSLFLLRDNFRLTTALISRAEGNYLLRSKQYISQMDFEIAKHIVCNKLLNQSILQDAITTKSQRRECEAELLKQSSKMNSMQELLGWEGSASRNFFKSYFSGIQWKRRLPRTKYDEINTLMDLGYTMLFNYIDALLALYGFDSYKGVYHKLFFQRKSLVCDIMEPFRCIIDKQILKSHHLKQIDPADFTVYKNQYQLKYDQQKKYMLIFSQALTERKEELFCYVRDYYYCILNDAHDYPTFII